MGRLRIRGRSMLLSNRVHREKGEAVINGIALPTETVFHKFRVNFQASCKLSWQDWRGVDVECYLADPLRRVWEAIGTEEAINLLVSRLCNRVSGAVVAPIALQKPR